MPRAARNALAAQMVAIAIVVTAGRTGAHHEPIAAPDHRDATIALHVINDAGVSRDFLDDARARVERIYAVIGVGIVWVDGGETANQRRNGRFEATVMLLSREMAQKKISADRIRSGVLGQAHIPSGRVYIFCDRIATMPGAPTYFPIPLGDVIAHEVGHLVLSSNSHSRSGIMRANMDVHAIRLQSFEKTQVRTIRSMLMELMARATEP